MPGHQNVKLLEGGKSFAREGFAFLAPTPWLRTCRKHLEARIARPVHIYILKTKKLATKKDIRQHKLCSLKLVWGQSFNLSVENKQLNNKSVKILIEANEEQRACNSPLVNPFD